MPAPQATLPLAQHLARRVCAAVLPSAHRPDAVEAMLVALQDAAARRQ